MRELKFRAWDDLNKKWLLGYEYPNLGGFSMMGEVMAFGEYTKMLNCFDCSDWRHIKLMQYTGLKDKNGKEIYEGDIITVRGDKPIKVGWNSRFASFVLNREGWAYAHWFGESCDPEDCEVIGNIYENPNLLSHADHS